MNDADLLSACPDTISISGVFKATPKTEGDRRYVYMEASNEGLDQQDEIIVSKALRDSSDYYLRYGNVDIEHLTKIGPRLGIADSQSYEIGQPKEVGQTGKTTFVKAEIYRGDGPAAHKANEFWSSLVDIKPPQRWYPSVGGAALKKSIAVDPETQAKRVMIEQVRWHNIGMSKTPVNQHIRNCTTVPVGVFAKCMTADGFDVAKALTAGYGTDSADLTGGGSLRKQSLAGKPANYFDFRNRVSKAVRERVIGSNPGAIDIAKYAQSTFGLSPEEAADHTDRFMSDLKDGLTRGRQ